MTDTADSEYAAAMHRLEELQQGTKVLTHFARRVAHDIGNFITVTRAYSELLLGESDLSDTARDDVREIHRSSEAVVQYLQRVTSFARVGSMRLTAVDVPSLLEDVRRTCSVDSGIDISSMPARVTSDATLLADAIRELLTNACEASPPGGRVTLSVTRQSTSHNSVVGGLPIPAGEWVVIRITDSGRGFSGPVEDLMSPLVTTKDAIRGAGIGLSLARAVAWKSGGQLVLQRIDNETHAELWLPASASDVTSRT